MSSAGQLLVSCLEAQGVDRAFCVPGESYLAVLDAMYNSKVETVVARHESGAAIMAEADGKMTGRPGVCFVTRGPGATNASAGVHIARQDSTPMVLFVGQIGRDMRGREAFQEMDYRAFYGSVAKWVEEVDRPERIPEIVSHAWHIAMSGRPGPVVIALPEDMLRDEVAGAAGPYVEVAEPAPTPEQVDAFTTLLGNSKSPIIIAGGSRWDETTCLLLRELSERLNIPVATSFRRQYLFDAVHSNYAGDVGIAINPELRKRITASDAVVLLGCRFSEMPSQGYELLDIPGSGKGLVHVHPGAEEIGRIYVPEIGINSAASAFLNAVLQSDIKGSWKSECESANRSYHDWTDNPAAGIGSVTMSHTVSVLRDRLPENAILTNGAGNYAGWANRFYRYSWGTQLAPTSGSMGYGLPAAVAAAKRYPDRTVVVMAGDGCFQMTCQEFGVVCEHDLNVKVIVCDNSIYGTIRMHQERDYPGRVSATNMRNPDFAAWASSYGAFAATVEADADFSERLDEIIGHKGPALLHLKLDARDIAPGKTIPVKV